MALYPTAGAINEWQPQRSHRERYCVRVRDPAVGFFITGSSIRGLNGVYGSLQRCSPQLKARKCQLLYQNDQTDWKLALLQAPAGAKAPAKKRPRPPRRRTMYDSDSDSDYDTSAGTEWCFIDPSGRDRFWHKGDTIIPGAGLRWKHLHRATGGPGQAMSSAAIDGAEDAESSSEDHDDEWAAAQLDFEEDAKDDFDDLLGWDAPLYWPAAGGAALIAVAAGICKYKGSNAVFVVLLMLAILLAFLALVWPILVPPPERPKKKQVSRERQKRTKAKKPKQHKSVSSRRDVYSHETSPTATNSQEERIVQQEPDNEDELPWQVIALLDISALRDLRYTFQCHQEKIRQAQSGSNLKQPGPASIEGCFAPGSCIYRVVAADGVTIHSSPNNLAPKRGIRKHGEYIRAVGSQGDWLLVASGERQLTIARSAELWVFLGSGSSLLELIPEEETAQFGDLPEEGPEADLFDRPFEPRLEGTEPTKIDQDNTLEAEQDNHEKLDQDQNVAPHTVVERGDLGAEAAEVARLAKSDDLFVEQKQGIRGLERLLGKELSSKAGSESSAALRLRLTLVRALLRGRREAEALKESAAACAQHPGAAAASFFHARCLLRVGRRDEGAELLTTAAAAGPDAGADAAWARAQAALQLREVRCAGQLKAKADDLYTRGSFQEASAKYGEAIASVPADDKWGRAILFANRAACHRRSGTLQLAINDCDTALTLFPYYSRAHARRAICLLELGKPQDAINAFEALLRVDRNWPDISTWLVRAHAAQRRLKSGSGASKDRFGRRVPSSPASQEAKSPSSESTGLDPTLDHYQVLGVTTDASPQQLKRAYRLMSLKYHPDKEGGSTTDFQRVALAFQTLSDPDKKRAYDEGVDTKKRTEGVDSEDSDDDREMSLREEVERHYFPDRFEFWPFGDPFIERRKIEARRRRGESTR